MGCLLNTPGPTPSLEAILNVIVDKFISTYAIQRLIKNLCGLISDMVTPYKSKSMANMTTRISIRNSPAIVTGGACLASNKQMRLFGGKLPHTSPCYSTETRSSGLFKILGVI